MSILCTCVDTNLTITCNGYLLNHLLCSMDATSLLGQQEQSSKNDSPHNFLFFEIVTGSLAECREMKILIEPRAIKQTTS